MVPDVDNLWDAANFWFKDFWEFCTIRTYIWFHGCHLYMERDVSMESHGEGERMPRGGRCLGMSQKNRGWRPKIPNSGAPTQSRRLRLVLFGDGTGTHSFLPTLCQAENTGVMSCACSYAGEKLGLCAWVPPPMSGLGGGVFWGPFYLFIYLHMCIYFFFNPTWDWWGHI